MGGLFFDFEAVWTDVFITLSRVGLDKYFASKEGVADRERRSKDAYLAPRRENGFQDGKKTSDGASRHSI